MKPVTQTIFGEGRGNCFAACVASILEVDLEEVPNFCADHPGDEWWARYNEWLRWYGFRALHLNWTEGNTVESIAEALPNVETIVSGPGPRGCDHSVVYRGGEMVHDPHPSRAGLVSIKGVDVFVSLDPCVVIWRPLPMTQLVRENILLALEKTDGNVSKAAKLLGIGRATLYRRLGEYKQREARGV